MDGFERNLVYERWANRRVMQRLREVPDAPEARRLFAHLQAGITVWTMRLRGEDSTAEPIWPDLDLVGAEERMRENEKALAEFGGKLSPEFLDTEISYTNQHGLSYTTSVRDVLTHLALHGAYHRGQIARVLRALGHEPVNTDFITWVREESGQPWVP